MQYLFYVLCITNLVLIVVLAVCIIRMMKIVYKTNRLQEETLCLLEQSNLKQSPKMLEKIIITKQTPSNLEDIKAYVLALEKRLFHYFRLSENSPQLSELQDYIQKREGVEFAHEKRHALIKTKVL